MADPRILGVDPGVTGGLALLAGTTIESWDIPTVAGEIDVDTLIEILRTAAPDMTVIERASARPGQGVSSTFKFGMAFGMLRAIVAAREIPHHFVTAATWKKHFRLDADKEKARALAIQFWPGCGLFGLKKSHGKAEASLIARYGAEVLWRRS